MMREGWRGRRNCWGSCTNIFTANKPWATKLCLRTTTINNSFVRAVYAKWRNGKRGLIDTRGIGIFTFTDSLRHILPAFESACTEKNHSAINVIVLSSFINRFNYQGSSICSTF